MQSPVLQSTVSRESPRSEGVPKTNDVSNLNDASKTKVALLLASDMLPNVFVTMILLLACIPVIRVLHVLFSVGANCASNDYIVWIGTVDSILSGRFNWLNLPAATYHHSHFLLVPFLIELAQICAGIWDIRTESLTGLLLLAVSTFLQWDMVRESLRKRLQATLLACIIAVNFSTTQYSNLLSGIFGVSISGSCFFGLTLSLWGLSKYRNQKDAVAPLLIMGIGFVISAYSSGTVLPVSVCLLLTLWVLGYRSWRAAAAWSLACALAWFPYIYFGYEAFISGKLSGHGHLSLARALDLLGRSMSNDIANQLGPMTQSVEAGGAGCIAVFCMVSYLVAKGIRLPGMVPVLILSLYSLLSAVLIAIARVHIAPWYAVFTKLIWVTVVTLAVYCISQVDRVGETSKLRITETVLPATLGIIVLFLFTWRYVQVNDSYDDKHFYLKSRAPASESYQRHYLTAPTYGEPLLFQWESGGANQAYAHSLGSVLERHGLLGFGKCQQWTLQGDSFLNNVLYSQKPNFSLPIWTDGAWPIHPMPWHDYHHLDMAVKTPQVVTWRLTLPPDSRAVLRTACCPAVIENGDPFNDTNATVTIRSLSKASLSSQSVLQKTLYRNSSWMKMEKRLDRFAGQDVEIEFSSMPRQAVNEAATSSFPKKEPNWVVFQYPRIDLVLKDGTYGTRAGTASGTDSATISRTPAGMISRPCNTDISPDFPGYKDLGTTLNVVPGKQSAFDGGNFVVRNFSHIQLTANTRGGTGAGALIITFNYANYPEFAAVLPLLPDAKGHAYSYDFKLLQAPADAKLKSVEFLSQHEDQTIQVSDVKLLKAFLN